MICMSQVQIFNWNHCIWRAWINPLCKSGLDPIDFKFSLVCKDKQRIFSLLAKFNSKFCLIFIDKFHAFIAACLLSTKWTNMNNCARWACIDSTLPFNHRMHPILKTVSGVVCVLCISESRQTLSSVVFNVYVGPDLILMHPSERIKSIT